MTGGWLGVRPRDRGGPFKPPRLCRADRCHSRNTAGTNQFPEGLLGAIEPARNLARGPVLGLEDREAEDEKRLLWVQAVIGSVHSDEEDAFREIVRAHHLPA